MKKIFFLFILIALFSKNYAQNSACNKLGAWIWVIEETTCKNHAELADSLKKLGIKRAYVKVADGSNFAKWPELDDKTLVSAYKTRGIEIWAWSYNYPNNEDAQAEALLRATKTGYQGFVVDVETEFDKDSLRLYKLFSAFDKKKQAAIAQGFAPNNYELRVTTWGNPIQHFFNIKAMDNFVSAYMPQTYVEQWGTTYIQNMEKWIDQGNADYKKLGATKPIHHIVAHEKTMNSTGALTAANINNFISKAGGETSLWRVPGGSISAQNWATWRGINWKKDFCAPSAIDDIPLNWIAEIFPNPTSENFQVILDNENITRIRVSNSVGQVVFDGNFQKSIEINSANWEKGIYFCQIEQNKVLRNFKIVVQN